MTQGLVRYQQAGDLHFVTFSCYRRQQHLGSAAARTLFERSLETMRLRYEFFVVGYVVMPEHIHLLISEPKRALLAKAIQALKLSLAVQRQ
ncbi:MAG: transposase, partial [Acidobacteriaceae bacterium]